MVDISKNFRHFLIGGLDICLWQMPDGTLNIHSIIDTEQLGQFLRVDQGDDTDEYVHGLLTEAGVTLYHWGIEDSIIRYIVANVIIEGSPQYYNNNN